MCSLKNLIYKYFYAKSDAFPLLDTTDISEVFLQDWAWGCAAVISMWEAHAEGSGVEGHHQLHESKANLRYIRPYLN